MSEGSSKVTFDKGQLGMLVVLLTVVQFIVLGVSGLVSGGRAKGVEEERTRQVRFQVDALQSISDKQAESMNKLIFQVGNLATEVGSLANQTEKNRSSIERMNYDNNRRFPMYAVPREATGKSDER